LTVVKKYTTNAVLQGQKIRRIFAQKLKDIIKTIKKGVQYRKSGQF